MVTAVILRLLYSLYYKTLRIKIVNPQFTPHGLSSDQSMIYALWHSRTFTVLPFYRDFKVGILTLQNWKNRVYDQIGRSFGYDTVPALNTRTVIRSLEKILSSSRSVALAVDGPHGPVGIVKPGTIALARITGKPIVAVRIEAEKSFRIKHRWDRYEIPFPFTQITMTFNEPIQVDHKNSEACVQAIKKNLGYT